MDFARTMFGSLPTENSERLMLAIKADADTVQYGATPPPVPVSQTLNGLGFFVCWRRFPRQKHADSGVSKREIVKTGFATLESQQTWW